MEGINNEVGFYNRMAKAYENNLPFVTFRKPGGVDVQLFIQNNDQLYHTKDYQESGFVFAPFDDKESAILFPLSKSTIYSCEFLENRTQDKKNDIASLNPSEVSKTGHIALVKKGIEFLEKNTYKKVVLSRKEHIKYKEFEIIKTLKKLLVNYKNAFVYCWFHPKVGLWLGATPETLLKVKENTFSTMALAATQVYNVNKKTDAHASVFSNIIWGAKEIAEHQFVTDFILEQLNVDVEVSKPYTTRAGSLLHLRTDISGNLTEQLRLNKIVNLLHPTPAVCGVPKQKAKAFILQNENYNRQFYTGFLGELNVDNMSDLYVNLRCMQVFKDHIEIYIGGGITKDSNPESEWEETVAKSKVMLKVL